MLEKNKNYIFPKTKILMTLVQNRILNFTCPMPKKDCFVGCDACSLSSLTTEHSETAFKEQNEKADIAVCPFYGHETGHFLMESICLLRNVIEIRFVRPTFSSVRRSKNFEQFLTISGRKSRLMFRKFVLPRCT